MIQSRQAAPETDAVILLDPQGRIGQDPTVDLLADTEVTIQTLGADELDAGRLRLDDVRLAIHADLYPALSLKRRTRWPRR